RIEAKSTRPKTSIRCSPFAIRFPGLRYAIRSCAQLDRPKPVLPPGLKNFGVTRSKTPGVLPRAVPKTSDAPHRENENLRLVIASAAKQSRGGVHPTLDCFVASLLAMTNLKFGE